MGAVLSCHGYLATILPRKAEYGDAILGGKWIGGRCFEKSSHLLVKLPGKMAFWGTFQANLIGTPLSMRRSYA
jgi:hypothetical protein